jgi:hypothetical protein
MTATRHSNIFFFKLKKDDIVFIYIPFPQTFRRDEMVFVLVFIHLLSFPPPFILRERMYDDGEAASNPGHCGAFRLDLLYSLLFQY